MRISVYGLHKLQLIKLQNCSPLFSWGKGEIEAID